MLPRPLLIGLGSALAVWAALVLFNQPSMHAPLSEAEKALDTTLKKVGADNHFFENAHINPGEVPLKHRVDYLRMMSKRLLDELAAQQKHLATQDCGEDYLNVKDMCGFNYNPVTCAQDVNDAYLYRTLSQETHKVAIDYTWPYKQNDVIAHYGLVKDEGVWKIDSVQCVFAK